jgi:acetyl esterase/lipase
MMVSKIRFRAFGAAALRLSGLGIAASLVAAPVFAQQQEDAFSRAERPSRPYQAAARVTRTVIYGDDLRQQIDVYEPADAVEAQPLVLFIHGGGWSMGSHKSVGAKPAHFNASGYYFASAGYRVLPGAPVEQQAADIGAAIAALRGQAGAIGFDPDRIAIIGHSSGAHLAALLASDPAYAGDAFDAVRGVVLLDSGAYDIAARIDGANPRSWQLYNNVFGSDPVRHAALSPITHIGGADVPNWLALYVGQREETRVQAQMLVNKLIAAGSEAGALPIAGTNHGRLNREIGTGAGAAQTEAVDAFLERVLR